METSRSSLSLPLMDSSTDPNKSFSMTSQTPDDGTQSSCGATPLWTNARHNLDKSFSTTSQTPDDGTPSSRSAFAIPGLDEKFKWVIDNDWAYEKDVLKFMAIELRTKDWVPMGAVVGPAVPWAFGSLAYVWISFVVMPFIGMWLTDCPAPRQLLASYPTWIWMFGVPFFVGCFFMEWKVLRYAILPLFHQCWSHEAQPDTEGSPSSTSDGIAATQGALSVGFFDHHAKGTYSTWLAAIGFVSFMNHLSIISNGLFLVKVLKAEQCNMDMQVNNLWKHVMDRSSMKHIPILGSIIKDASFVHIVLAIWALMLLQPLYALVTSMPIEFLYCKSGPDYKIGWTAKRHRTKKEQLPGDSAPHTSTHPSGSFVIDKPLKHQYRTATWRKHNHAQALFHVAEGARMASISSLRVRALTNYLKGRTSKPSSKIGHEELNVLRSINAAALTRYVLVGLLENSAMLNVQITTLAMSAYMHKENWSGMSALDHSMIHWQINVSLFAGLSIGLWKVGDAYGLMRAAWRELASGRLRDLKSEDDFHQRRQFLRFEILVVMICVVFFVVSTVLAVSKLVMLYICPDNFWNFSWSLNQKHGCVNMSSWENSLNTTGSSRWDSVNQTVAPRYPQ